MSKQLILITAPFGCGHCARAIKELPNLCEEKGWEFIEMKNEKTEKPDERLPVDLYPTIMLRVKGEMKEILKGYNQNKVITELKKY
tara:strand:- start:39 stop:296 length:258 start_codon:yes stop_codon:yes gene_type:complete